MEIKEYHVPEESAGVRLDAYCAEQEPDFSRGYIKNLLTEGAVKVDGSQKKASYKLKGGEVIAIAVPDPVESAIEPENIPLEIIYEDEDVIVVNKPKGMVVHPAPGSPSGTLVNALMYHTGELSSINGVYRPGILHRIDKDTSGLLMVAKNNAAHQNLTGQLKAHTITRQYKALVKGIMENNRGTIDMPIGRHPKDRIRMAVVKENAKEAVTHFETLKRYVEGYTLMQFRLETGRTHQIRVHMQAIGYPIAGDPLYKGDKKNPFKTQGQCLHAELLGFKHPRTGEYMEFSAPLPKEFQAILDGLKEIE
ncbi:RluA family pseudouridine synthase [Eubacterium sp. 1001713B170207_170306_E7]|uniref:RluA family pseudouridine synthase n=1 Tax=Eubacterium sp. 1001713B170207_170306_E7 TaxID=2787097 RepID=UPI00189B52FA|nr:RluA family pseudouridine synthase [Eubacterium sp. 1001713B170207_170306_E7]